MERKPSKTIMMCGCLGFSAALLVLSSCGGEPVDDQTSDRLQRSATSYASANKFVVWQHNIGWYASATAAETAIEHAMTDFAAAPDIMLFQECGAPCICGSEGKYDHRTGKCDSVGGASIERALKSLHKRNEYTFRRNGLRVIGFRDARFAQIGSDMLWGASKSGRGAYIAKCGTVSVGKQLSVMLRDKVHCKRRQVLVSTGHWFVSRDCACRQLHALEAHWKRAPELRNRAGANARSYVDLHIAGGDWNAEPFTALPSAYRTGGRCDGVRLGGGKHHDTAGAGFTFCQGAGGVSTPARCYNKKKVDYLWARKYNHSGITWRGSPDRKANYFNDHRAIRTVFSYGD